MLRAILFPIKFFRVFYTYSRYVVISTRRKESLSPLHKKRLGSYALHYASIKGLRNLDIQVEFVGKPLAPRPSMWISNHVSYLDPMLIASKQPTLFITSQEVREQPFLGYTCAAMECHFVERRNPRGISKEVDSIGKTLDGNMNVHLFPEATTGSGEALLPFKSSFFALPHRLNIPIQPMYLEYTHVNGEAINSKNKDLLYYYGEASFFPHFMKLLCCRQIKAKIKFLPPLFPEEYPSRKELAQATYESILNAREGHLQKMPTP